MHWMREKCSMSGELLFPQSIQPARAFASDVFPTPWESARMTCPPAIIAATMYSSFSGSIDIIDLILSTSFDTEAGMSAVRLDFMISHKKKHNWICMRIFINILFSIYNV